MPVRTLNIKYRGFELGYVIGVHGYKAAWRSSLEDQWKIGFIFVDEIVDCKDLAMKCIDFNYQKDAEEFELGRKLCLDEIIRLNRRRPKEA